MTKVLRILLVLLFLASVGMASVVTRVEAADARSLRELGIAVDPDDLHDIPKMQELLIEGFAAFGIDFAIDSALILYDPRTGRVFFMHPSREVADRAARLLRTAAAMAKTA